jgi:hypothetical protein
VTPIAVGAIVLLGVAATAVVLVFGIDTLRNAPETFVASPRSP